MADKKNMISSAPVYNYTEKAPDINPDEFQKVIDSRRSVRVYDKTPIPEDIVRRCLGNALLAPNSSNLQQAEIYWISDRKKRSQLEYAALNQVAARTAAELFVIIARTRTWKKHSKDMVKLFNTSKEKVPQAAFIYYKKLVPFVYSIGVFSVFGFIKRILFFLRGLFKPIIREPVSKSGLKLWAVKSTALAAENLMLSFRAYGFDSCPMEGYDSRRVKKLLKLPRDAAVVMIVSAGKRGDGGIYGPRIRFDSSRFIHKI